MSKPEVFKSLKSGFGDHQNTYKIVRGNEIFLRVAESKTQRGLFEIMTATASEDNAMYGSKAHIACKNQSLLVDIALELNRKQYGDTRKPLQDHIGRPYVKIGEWLITPPDTVFDLKEHPDITLFFKMYDEAIHNTDGPTMEDIYSDLCVTEGQDVYLHDGMWLRPDGTMYER
ncbi:hypothetical protein HUK76_20350 [Citrobacter portucalensis]|uniref:hypothetical protein n=1 Tax=Citrobacter portucalensis TaxID=1639133 RepID=UPI001580239F|nr:hypothetical protein [Citrobacter portucalensis]NUH56007.1 hypothetical protein [Citrobacter portucalensis]